MKYVKVIGILLLVMTVLSFLLVIIIPNYYMHSAILFLISYGLLGFLVRNWKYPYFSGYMTACLIVIANTIFGDVILDIPLLFTPDIGFWSFIFAITLTMLSVFSFRKFDIGGEAA
ncbi:hypothetical protein QMK38_12945 [Lysinibacillus fusiformis]|nr:hypothetical protein [Lysinibacillus fusiformis]